jgi:hypothetical protein
VRSSKRLRISGSPETRNHQANIHERSLDGESRLIPDSIPRDFDYQSSIQSQFFAFSAASTFANFPWGRLCVAEQSLVRVSESYICDLPPEKKVPATSGREIEYNTAVRCRDDDHTKSTRLESHGVLRFI